LSSCRWWSSWEGGWEEVARQTKVLVFAQLNSVLVGGRMGGGGEKRQKCSNSPNATPKWCSSGKGWEEEERKSKRAL